MFKSSFLNGIRSFYSFFIKIGSNLQSLFLFYMRITWGHQFFLLGLSKLHSIHEVSYFFRGLGLPQPTISAYTVSLVEIICGFMIFIGFSSRLASIPLIITMLVALSTAHSADISEFRFLLQPLSLVKQTPYPFLITSLLVFLFGPGRISVDAWIKRWVKQHARY
jgi:putative oxidoreductase